MEAKKRSMAGDEASFVGGNLLEARRHFEDQTEYILALVYKDRDMSRKENVCSYPDCRCPFDMGPDNKCLQGKPNPEDV